MSGTKVAKIVVLAILLIAAGFFFGQACERINRQYELILLLDSDSLWVVLRLLLAMAAVAVAGGLVAALVRPLWVSLVAFAASALAVFLGWGVSLPSLVVALIYFVAGLLYARGVGEALDNRLKFSVEPISGSQSVLLAGLAIAACVSIYFGYAAEIEEKGFSLPPAFTELMGEFGMAPMRQQIEARTDLTSEQKEELLAQMTEGFEEAWLQPMEQKVQSYERLVPIAVAFFVFQLLAVVNTLFSWVPIVILAVLFPILTGVRVIGKVTETREVERLSLG
jgi:hypothetical protein